MASTPFMGGRGPRVDRWRVHRRAPSSYCSCVPISEIIKMKLKSIVSPPQISTPPVLFASLIRAASGFILRSPESLKITLQLPRKWHAKPWFSICSGASEALSLAASGTTRICLMMMTGEGVHLVTSLKTITRCQSAEQERAHCDSIILLPTKLRRGAASKRHRCLHFRRHAK